MYFLNYRISKMKCYVAENFKKSAMDNVCSGKLLLWEDQITQKNKRAKLLSMRRTALFDQDTDFEYVICEHHMRITTGRLFTDTYGKNTFCVNVNHNMVPEAEPLREPKPGSKVKYKLSFDVWQVLNMLIPQDGWICDPCYDDLKKKMEEAKNPKARKGKRKAASTPFAAEESSFSNEEQQPMDESANQRTFGSSFNLHLEDTETNFDMSNDDNETSGPPEEEQVQHRRVSLPDDAVHRIFTYFPHDVPIYEFNDLNAVFKFTNGHEGRGIEMNDVLIKINETFHVNTDLSLDSVMEKISNISKEGKAISFDIIKHDYIMDDFPLHQVNVNFIQY